MGENGKNNPYLKRTEDSVFQSRSTIHSPGTNTETFLLSPVLLVSQKSTTGVYKFHAFTLLTAFLNVCYYFLLTPFRFKKQQRQFSQGKGYVLQTNIVQTTLSSIFVLLITIYSLGEIYIYLFWDMEANPKVALMVADRICGLFLPILWIITFWINIKQFTNLLVFCQGETLSLLEQPVKTSVPKTPSKILIYIVLALAFIKIANNVEVYISDILYAYPFLYFEYFNEYPLWLTIFFMPIAMGVVIIICLFDVFCVIEAVIVHQVCSHLSDQIEKLSNDNLQREQDSQLLEQYVKQLSSHYMDLISVTEIINEIFGPAVVIYYISSCPSVVWMIFDLFNKDRESTTLAIWVYDISLFVIFNVVASNGCNKVQRYKQWLFKMSVAEYCSNKKAPYLSNSANGHVMHGESTAKERSNSLQLFLNFMHRQVNAEDVALKGYKFFAITYSLVGTMLGFVITFATVIYQFELDKNKNKQSTTPSPTTLSESCNVTFSGD